MLSAEPKAKADNTYVNLDYSRYHKNLIQWLFKVGEHSFLGGQR